MFCTNNHTLFHLWWKENLVKCQKVWKYYVHGCSLPWCNTTGSIINFICFPNVHLVYVAEFNESILEVMVKDFKNQDSSSNLITLLSEYKTKSKRNKIRNQSSAKLLPALKPDVSF